MSTQPNGRQAELRSLISDFLTERLNGKLEKLHDDDPKRSTLREQFVPTAWLDNAARRVGQIQAVTHSLKPIHPYARGSSLFCEPGTLAPRADVGSHALGVAFEPDVDGNAAALDVYQFLKMEHEGRSFLSLAIQADPDLAAALSDDADCASAWMSAFAGLAAARGKLSSHTLAKQLYWRVGDDPHDDGSYHLLAPLYPTSLVHRVYQVLQDDRFSDDAKAAREARKANGRHARPVREYPQLAIQHLGGTKPQNISQLNSERHGDNCLLASLPPVWQAVAVKPLFGLDSLFKALQRRPSVRTLLAQLRSFLESKPASNRETRRHRDELLEDLLDELMQFTAELHTLPPGWTKDARCDLPRAHTHWLDPLGADEPKDDAIDALSSDFANWLNHHLRDPLPLDDAAYLHWRQQARELFKEWEREDRHARA